MQKIIFSKLYHRELGSKEGQKNYATAFLTAGRILEKYTGAELEGIAKSMDHKSYLLEELLTLDFKLPDNSLDVERLTECVANAIITHDQEFASGLCVLAADHDNLPLLLGLKERSARHIIQYRLESGL